MSADYLITESALDSIAPSRRDALMLALDDAAKYAPDQLDSLVIEPSQNAGLLSLFAVVPKGNARSLAVQQTDEQLIRTIWAVSSAWKVAREIGGTWS